MSIYRMTLSSVVAATTRKSVTMSRLSKCNNDDFIA